MNAKFFWFGSLAMVVLTVAAENTSAASAIVAGVRPAAAATFAFDRNNTFGWRFTPAKDIEVSELGYFDGSSLPGGLVYLTNALTCQSPKAVARCAAENAA
jgi:hypothetical protein